MKIRDYYLILGIIKTAEDIVVKAAYRALAQKYHPDKFSGDPAVAQQRMQEINEAYSVLSDAEKRRGYDKTYDFQSSGTDAETDTEYFDSELDQVWREVTEYYPDLTDIEKSLSKISKQLVHTFKYSLIESKQFEQRKELAKLIEEKYLESYFGSNKELIEFGKILILCKFKNAAKKLNRAVNILGAQVNSKLVKDKIKESELTRDELIMYYLVFNQNNTNVKNIASGIMSNKKTENIDWFIKNLGGRLKMHEDIFKKYYVEFDTWKTLSTKAMNQDELIAFSKKIAQIIV
jgi:curved DNA-binding protein CbpA